MSCGGGSREICKIGSCEGEEVCMGGTATTHEMKNTSILQGGVNGTLMMRKQTDCVFTDGCKMYIYSLFSQINLV